MKFSKKKNTLVALTVGSVIFVSAAAVGIASSNGYAVYKQSLKNLMTAENFTLSAKLSLLFDGEQVENNLEINTKMDLNGDVKLSYVEVDNRRHEAYFQDGMNIHGSMYNENGESDQMNYTVDDIYNDNNPEPLICGLMGGSDKSADKMLRFLEIASDLVIGDLKNNFIYNGSENGFHSYSIALDNFQIPEIISSGLDLAMTLNHDGLDTSRLEERASDDDPTVYLFDNVKIANVSCNILVDDDGNISSNDLHITVTGDDWDGNGHTLEFMGELSCSDFGTTVPDRLDLENTPNVSYASQVHAERICELEKILSNDDLTDDERTSYEDELNFEKRQLEQQTKENSSRLIEIEEKLASDELSDEERAKYEEDRANCQKLSEPESSYVYEDGDTFVKVTAAEVASDSTDALTE